MARFERGKPIRARDLNQTTGEAQTGANPSVSNGQVHVGPRGHSIHIPKKYVLPDGAMWAQYTSDQKAGQYNVVEIYDTFSTHTGQIILKVRKPEIPGNDALAITHKGVGKNEIVPVQVRGYSLVEYYVEHYVSDSQLDIRLGTLASSLYAHWVPLGPFQVINLDTERIGGAKTGQDDSDVTHTLRLVPIEIIGRRGDYQPIQGTVSTSTPYQVIYFDSNYIITPGPTGVVEVHMA